jgi:plastocyanin
MVLKHLRALVAAAAVAGAAAACGGSAPAPAQAPPADAKRVDPATAGSITGKVSYDGPAPQNPIAKLDSDPACAREHPNGMALDTVLVANGGLENVFVYVKDGLGTYYFETPTETIKLDQKGCRYTPHVFGLRAGQPVEISNSDPTMHTVHAIATSNQEFNLSQPIQGIKNTKTFTAPEVMVHFKCNVHTWMDAYTGVLSHPYFAVTASGGAFELKGLPPGTYTVEAWHEKLGTQTQSVTVGTKESKTVDFRFVAQ